MIKMNTDRLLDMLMSAGPDVSACDVLEQYKQEFDRSIAEQQAAAEAHARDNPPRWGIRRVQLRDTGNGQVIDTIETASLTYEDMAPFCKHVGISLDDLQAVLDGRKRSVVGKHGQEWMSWVPQWSSSRPFDVNQEARRELAEQLKREDQELTAKMAIINEQRKRASEALQATPSHDVWRSN